MIAIDRLIVSPRAVLLDGARESACAPQCLSAMNHILCIYTSVRSAHCSVTSEVCRLVSRSDSGQCRLIQCPRSPCTTACRAGRPAGAARPAAARPHIHCPLSTLPPRGATPSVHTPRHTRHSPGPAAHTHFSIQEPSRIRVLLVARPRQYKSSKAGVLYTSEATCRVYLSILNWPTAFVRFPPN